MDKILGENIRLIRLKKGLSQQNIADDLEITVSSYSKMERGEIDLKYSRIVQIANALKVSVFEIIGSDEKNGVHDPLKEYGTPSTESIYTTLEFLLQKVNSLEKEISLLKNQWKKD